MQGWGWGGGNYHFVELPEKTKDETFGQVRDMFLFSLIRLTSVSLHTKVYKYLFLINVLYFLA